jgi:hypothetical protein
MGGPAAPSIPTATNPSTTTHITMNLLIDPAADVQRVYAARFGRTGRLTFHRYCPR